MQLFSFDAFRRYALRLLAPNSDICITCGRIGPHDVEFPGICGRCVLEIPWIGGLRCLYCGRPIGCPDCVRPTREGRHFVCSRSAVSYTPLMRDWIGQFKFKGNERYGPLLGAMMEKAFAAMRYEFTTASISQTAEGIISRNMLASGAAIENNMSLPWKRALWNVDVVTCVPVSETRLLERGFNQAHILAEYIAHRHKLPLIPLLMRPRDTGKQSFKTRSERTISMRGAFAAAPDALELIRRASERGLARTPVHQRHVRILLVDDIYTTGSTLNACSHILQETAAESGLMLSVFGLTLARS